MYSPASLVTFVLLASAGVIHALPAEPYEVDMSHFNERDITARSATIAIGTEASEANCPATNNGAAGNYAAHSYTENQVHAAMMEGAKMANDGKQIGTRKCH